jgi:hypothetical protein
MSSLLNTPTPPLPVPSPRIGTKTTQETLSSLKPKSTKKKHLDDSITNTTTETSTGNKTNKRRDTKTTQNTANGNTPTETLKSNNATGTTTRTSTCTSTNPNTTITIPHNDIQPSISTVSPSTSTTVSTTTTASTPESATTLFIPPLQGPGIPTLTAGSDSATDSNTNDIPQIPYGVRRPPHSFHKPVSKFKITTPTKRVIKPPLPITSNTSYVKAVIMVSPPNETHVVFRFERTDEDNSSWAEKLLDDEVNLKKTAWSKLENFVEGRLHYYIDDIKQINSKNYPIRLFLVKIPGPFNNEIVIDKAERIVSHINTHYQSAYKILHCVPGDLYWNEDNLVWSDIIGGQQAYDRIVKIAKAHPSPGFFETHQELILQHFHSNTFDHDLVTLFYAPSTLLHPSLQITPEAI